MQAVGSSKKITGETKEKSKSEGVQPPWFYIWTRNGVITPKKPLTEDPVPKDRLVFSCEDCKELFAFKETLDNHRRAFCRILETGEIICPYSTACGAIKQKDMCGHRRVNHKDDTHINFNGPILRPEFKEDIELLDSMLAVTDLPGMPRPRHGLIVFMHQDLPVPLLTYELLDERSKHAQKQARDPWSRFAMDRMLPYHLMTSPKSLVLPSGYEWGHVGAYRNHNHNAPGLWSCNLSSNAVVQHVVANQYGLSQLEDLANRISKIHPVRIFSGVLIDSGSTSIIGKWLTKLFLFHDGESGEHVYDAWRLPNTDAAADSSLFRITLKEYNDATGWDILNKITPIRKNLQEEFPTGQSERMTYRNRNSSHPWVALPEDMPTKDYLTIKKLKCENSNLRAEKEVLAHELATVIVDNL